MGPAPKFVDDGDVKVGQPARRRLQVWMSVGNAWRRLSCSSPMDAELSMTNSDPVAAFPTMEARPSHQHHLYRQNRRRLRVGAMSSTRPSTAATSTTAGASPPSRTAAPPSPFGVSPSQASSRPAATSARRKKRQIIRWESTSRSRPCNRPIRW